MSRSISTGVSAGFALSLAAAFAVCTPAHAIEHVILRSGFSYDCARHEPVADGRTRLFLEKGADSGYLDLPSDEILRVDVLPDPPQPAPVPVAAAGLTSASPAISAPPDVHALLVEAGAEHDIDVALLASVVKAESGGRQNAVSRTGAEGLMQLMPGTAKTLGVTSAFQADQNINAGTACLDVLLTRYHNNLPLALAAYNAGPGAVDKYHGIPPFPETRAYVVRVLRDFKRRKQAATTALASR